MRTTLFGPSLVVAFAAFAAAPALAGLDGTTISTQYYFPDLSSPYGFATATPPVFVVGAGTESTVDVEGVTFIDIDFSNSTLTLDFSTILNNPQWTNTDFNGLVFIGAGIGSITSFVVDPASTFGIDPADISIVGNELRFDWGGVTYGDGQTLTLTFSFVPEPASWAMLIAGFGLVGLASRRRRSALAA